MPLGKFRHSSQTIHLSWLRPLARRHLSSPTQVSSSDDVNLRLCQNWTLSVHAVEMQICPAIQHHNPNPNPDPWLYKPKIYRLRLSVDDYWCAKFQVLPIRGFHFVVLTYPHKNPHTYIPTHHDEVSTVPRIIVADDWIECRCRWLSGKIDDVHTWSECLWATQHDTTNIMAPMHDMEGLEHCMMFPASFHCFDTVHKGSLEILRKKLA